MVQQDKPVGSRCIIYIGNAKKLWLTLIIQKCPFECSLESNANWFTNAWKTWSCVLRNIAGIADTVCGAISAAIVNQNWVAS